jgi:hypothetical protein
LLSISVASLAGTALAAAGCSLPPAAPPAPQLLAGVANPYALAVDSTTVYVSKEVGGPVVTIPRDGGVVSTLSIRTNGCRVAVDQQKLYWSDGSAVYACDKSNCPGSTITVASDNAVDIAAAAGTVYWAVQTPGRTGPGRIMKSDQTGATPGAAVQVSMGQWVYELAVDDQDVYWIDDGVTGPGIMRAPIEGGTATMLTRTDAPSTLQIAMDATSVYLTTGDGRLVEVSKADGQSRVLLSNIGDFSIGLATDGTKLYVAGSNGLVSMPAHGGPVTTLVSDVVSPAGIALDDSSVYLADSGASVILKVPK